MSKTPIATNRHRLFLSLVALSLVFLSARAASAQDWDTAISLFNQKQYRQAAKAFHTVIKGNPEFWQAWYYIGVSHYNLQGYEDAIDAMNNYIKGAEKDEKGQAAGQYYVGFSYFNLKQYDKAIPALTRYLQLTEKLKEKLEPTARAALGRSYVFTEKYTEAVPVLTQSVTEIKDNATNFYYLAFAHQRLNQVDKAIAALNQALTISPKDVDSLTLLGNLYLAQAQQNPQALKQAISAGERLVAVKDDERAWNLLGQAYLFDKQYAKAAPYLDKYARAHTDQSAAWYNLGVAYSRSSQWKPAAQALEQAAKLAPTYLYALLELGYVYESDKLYDKALSTYEKAYQLSGQKNVTAKEGIERAKYFLAQPAAGAQQPTTAKKP